MYAGEVDAVKDGALDTPALAVEAPAQELDASVAQTARRDISQVFGTENWPRDFYPDDVEHE